MKKFFEEYYEVSAQIETVDKQNFDIILYDKDSKEKAYIVQKSINKYDESLPTIYY